eukprot:gene32160-38900_t
MKLLEDTKREINSYIQKVNQTYGDTLHQMRKHTLSAQELNFKYILPKYADRSLEDFKRLYNESFFQSIATKYLPSPSSHTSLLPAPIAFKDTYTYKTLLKQPWNQLVDSSRKSLKETEKLLKSTVKELQLLQDDLTLRAMRLEDNTISTIFPNSTTKEDLRNAREALERQLRKLETESAHWLDEKVHALNATLFKLQEKMHSTESLLDEMVGKKRATLHYTIMNDVTLKKVLTMIDAKDAGWQLIKEEDGFSVYRKYMSGNLGSPYACVKCFGVIKAPPLKVLELFEDNTRVREYNTLFDEGRDLEVVAENTKVVWASSTPIFPFKPRDFCTVVHTRKLKDGTMVVLNRATKHPAAPTTSKYVRGSVILGANIIQPIQGRKDQCRLTMITQVDPGGFTPPVIINHLCTLGPIGFMKNVETAANTRPSRKVLEEKKRLALQGAKR